MPKISVLLPVYNTDPSHLKRAIDSVLSQTFSDFELIIVNDASTSLHVDDIINKYNDPRIHYIKNNQNMGISAARNMMLVIAKGEYLAVMDHDDICAKTRFEKQVSFLDAHPEVVICGTNYKRFGKLFKNNIIRYPERHEDIKALLFFKCVIHHPSVMMRRNIIIDNQVQYDETYVSSNDRKLYMDLSKYGQLHNLQDILCFYRLHKGMTSKTKRAIIIEDQKRLRTEFLDHMQVSLSEHERSILDGYIINGRNRIRDSRILNDIDFVLCKLVAANRGSKYFPPQEFAQICASYLVKRCRNAAFYGAISSQNILSNTLLPLSRIRIPVWLRVFNKIF